MPQLTRYIASALALMMIAIVAAACGANTGEDTQSSGVEIQWLPTIQARQSNNIPAAGNESSLLPTVMPLATRAPRIAAAPTVAPPNNNAESSEEDFAFPVQQATPDPNAGSGGSLPFAPANGASGPGNLPAGNNAPPGFPGTNNPDTDNTATSNDDTNNADAPAQSGSMPPFGGSNGDASGGNTPFGNAGGPPGTSGGDAANLPFGGSAPGSGSSGSPFGGPGTQTVSGPVVGGTQPVTVFSCPESTCEVLGTIDGGTSLTLIDEWGAWSEVEFEEGTGYIYTDFISDGSQSPASGPGAQTVSGPPFGGGAPGASNGGPPFGNTGGAPGASNGGPPFGNSGGPPFGNTGGGPPFGNSGGPPGGNNPPFLNPGGNPGGGPPFGNPGGGPPFGNQATSTPQSQLPLPTSVGNGSFGVTPFPTIAFPSGFGGN